MDDAESEEKGLQAVETQLQNSTAEASDGKTMPMRTRRAFSIIPKFTGSSKECDPWKFQLSQLLSEDMDFPGLLDDLIDELDAVNL